MTTRPAFILLFLTFAACFLSGCESTGRNSASNVDRTGPGAPIYTQGEEIDTSYYNQL